MAEPKYRFKKDDGTAFPNTKLTPFSELYFPVKEKNDGTFGVNQIISVANMYFKTDAIVSDDDYLKTYNICRVGDIAYEGNKSKSFANGRLVENTIGDGIVSHVFVVFRPVSPFHNLDYWKYAINNENVMGRILARCTKKSTMMTDLVIADFLKQKTNVPCLEEQVKIADLFVTIDNLIRSLEEDIRLWEEKKKGVMQKIFSQEVRFKDENGEEYPEWEPLSFGSTCIGFEYGMNAAAVDYDGEHKYIRITDIDDASHKYLYDKISSPDGDLSEKYLVQDGDILLARTGASVGKSYLYNPGDGILYYAGFLIRMHVKSEYVPAFIFMQTLSDEYNKWVKVTSMRSGQPGINSTEYAEFSFMCPCYEEQQKIADCISSIEDVINIKKQKLEIWKTIKKGLLQQMFV